MAEDLGSISINKRFGANMVDQNYINQMLAQKAALQQAQSQRQSAPVVSQSSNPFIRGIGSVMMGIGEGMTGRPFLTNFNNNLYEQKQAQLKMKQWQEEQRIKAQEDQMQNQLRQSQIDLNNKMSQGMANGQDIVYRDPVSGVEVPKEVAISDMQSGKGRYVVNQRRVTKSGVIETPVVKPDTLTQDERTYITTAERMKKNLTALDNSLNYMYDKKGNPLWKQVQVDKVPFVGVGDTRLQKIKSSLNMLKADLPFLRGGKQLTPMEAQRVDVLLSPVGKTKEVYASDIKAFQNEFMAGENLAKYGFTPMGVKGETKKDANDFSSMSDEELKKIIAGGK